MANKRNANTYYIDKVFATNEELVEKNLLVTDIIVAATAANAILELSDSNGDKKILVDVATNGDSIHLPLRTPIRFPTGIRPTTVTNCVATVIFEKTSG